MASSLATSHAGNLTLHRFLKVLAEMTASWQRQPYTFSCNPVIKSNFQLEDAQR